MKPADITYVFHVFGTLTMKHVEWALLSLIEQETFYWKRFVLYNASDLPSADILRLVPRDRFEVVDEHPNVRNDFKSCSMDWLMQMQEISGTERYLCHKADFYLPPWTCREFESIVLNKNFIVMFHKYDMKSRCTLDEIRRYANLPWHEGIKLPETGSYPDGHLGKLAVPFEQQRGNMDGTMHGYTDDVRPKYRPFYSELTQRWGVASWFRKLDGNSDIVVVRGPKFFVCHMWHDTPDRADLNKNISPDERF